MAVFTFEHNKQNQSVEVCHKKRMCLKLNVLNDLLILKQCAYVSI